MVGNRRERDHWGDLGVDGLILLGRISRRWDVGIWTGLVWLRIGTGVEGLWVRQWTFGFREMRWISWLAANQLASQEGLHHAVSCCFTTRYSPSIRQQRLPQWRQFHIHSPMTHSLLSLIHPQAVHGRSRSSLLIFFFHYVHVLALVIPLFLLHANHTKLLPLKPRRTFLRNLSSHVTVVSRISAFTIYLQMSRPKCTVNTECNMVTEMLFTLGTAFIQAQNNIFNAIHVIPILTNFVPPERDE